MIQRLGDFRALLSGDSVPARKGIGEARFGDSDDAAGGNGKPHYVAEGSWNLLGGEKDLPAGDTTARQTRVVAGGRI